MKLIAFLFLFTFLTPLWGQNNFTFINAAWGTNQVQEELCGDPSAPSEFWLDGENASVCMNLDGESFSKNFALVPQEEFPTIGEFQTIYQTLDGYAIFVNGFYNKNQKVLTDVRFYYDGFLIGILSHPILY